MKKVFSTALYIAAALLLAGCAKTVKPGPNEANKRYFDAWMQLNHPEAEPSGLGIYVLENIDGDGIEVKEDGFALVDFKDFLYTKRNRTKLVRFLCMIGH
mgnify:CR=1 FL=1